LKAGSYLKKVNAFFEKHLPSFSKKAGAFHKNSCPLSSLSLVKIALLLYDIV